MAVTWLYRNYLVCGSKTIPATYVPFPCAIILLNIHKIFFFDATTVKSGPSTPWRNFPSQLCLLTSHSIYSFAFIKNIYIYRLYTHANLQDNRTYYYYYYYYYYYALFVITPIQNIHNYRAVGYMVLQLFCSYNSWHKHYHFSYHHLLINTYAPHYVYWIACQWKFQRVLVSTDTETRWSSN
jgi:hypothetical protein